MYHAAGRAKDGGRLIDRRADGSASCSNPAGDVPIGAREFHLSRGFRQMTVRLKLDTDWNKKGEPATDGRPRGWRDRRGARRIA